MEVSSGYEQMQRKKPPMYYRLEFLLIKMSEALVESVTVPKVDFVPAAVGFSNADGTEMARRVDVFSGKQSGIALKLRARRIRGGN